MSDPRNTPLPALILYSSRTGRTERAAQALKVHLDWRNYETDLVKIGAGVPPRDLAAYRLIVFGGSERGIPRLRPLPDPALLKHIEGLPALDGQKVAVFSVQLFEDDAHSANPIVARKLIEKGADVVVDGVFSARDPEANAVNLACECMIRVYK